MPQVYIVVPCFNEEKRLNLQEFTTFIKNNEINFCFVNDGSKDKTIKVLENLRLEFEEKVTILDLSQNVGKAEAVRAGVNHVLSLKAFDFVGYLDADLSTPLSELHTLLKVFSSSPEKKIVIGSRVKLLGRQIVRTYKRHYFGRVFSTMTSIILRLPVYDTQCGAKIFRSEEAEVIFKDGFITKWLFDIELLARFRDRVGIENVEDFCSEVPLMKWNEIGGSKLKLKDLLKVPYQLFLIYRNY